MLKINTRVVLFLIILPVFSHAQKWELIKEKDGVKVYTRKEKNSELKSFMGITDITTTMEKLGTMIGNPKNTEWWDKNLKEIKILEYEKDKYNKYYLIYDIPWPLSDRDLVVKATITTDPVTHVRTVMSVPIENLIPERPDLVRIKKYWQKWVLTPVGDNKIHVVLEGFVDPGGNIPSWLYNMVITETPLKIIHGLKENLDKK